MTKSKELNFIENMLFKNKLISETSVETIDLSPKIGVIFFFKKRNIGSGKMGPRDREKMRVRPEKCMHEQKKCMYLNENQIQ